MAYGRSFGTQTGNIHYVEDDVQQVLSLKTGQIGSETVWTSATTTPGLIHPFEMDRKKIEGSLLNGGSEWDDGHSWYRYTNVPSSMWAGARSEYPTTRNIAGLAAYLLAATNPTRAEVSIPNFIFEMKDLPVMLYQMGALLLVGRYGKKIEKQLGPIYERNTRRFHRLSKDKQDASHYLAYTFGWRPLIQDIKDMLKLTKSVEKRRNELNRLHGANGLKRRFKLGYDERVVNRLFDVAEIGNFQCVATGSNRYWGTVRWRPTSPSSLPGSLPDKEIRKILLGLTTDNMPLAVWNALPWSWLLDWFLHCNNVIGANQGKLSVHATEVCVMMHQLTVGSHPAITKTVSPSRSYTLSAGNFKVERKWRFTPSAGLSVQWPMLNGSQLSILGALAVARY